MGGGGMGAGGAGGAARSSVGMGGAGGGSRPQIRSFTYRVTPHVPIRGGTVGTTRSTAGNQSFGMGAGGFGGGRGGGGMGMEEKPGSTRIIWILPEGSRVKKGELVCELDSAAFRDELTSQNIRHSQAKSWVDRAETILQVAEIELREYRDGVYPQDREQIAKYIENCRTQEAQAKLTYDWSLDMFKKGLRSAAQLQGDRLLEERSLITLNEAIEMERRLNQFTAPRIIKSLEAKIEAVRSDLLSQKAAFQIEDERLRRLERAISKCKLYAPSDGLLVYARTTSIWGRTEDQIMLGATVREGQAIFQLPDPSNMEVVAKISESKIAGLKPGMDAVVRVDAFPNRLFRGKVKEIAPIPAKASIVSDVNLYSAVVSIDAAGFNELRSGMSAEVAFNEGEKPEVLRLPLEAIRWVGNDAFAAVAESTGRLRWQKLQVGMMSPTHAEIVSGLKVGDRVSSVPETLNPPRLEIGVTAPLVAVAR